MKIKINLKRKRQIYFNFIKFIRKIKVLVFKKRISEYKAKIIKLQKVL